MSKMDYPEPDQTPWAHTKRKPLTTIQRAKLFSDRGETCGGCGKRIKAGDKWIDEHVHALALGGGNEWSNREIRCEDCAKKKTAVDLKQAAKIKRVYAKHVGERIPKGRPPRNRKAIAPKNA